MADPGIVNIYSRGDVVLVASHPSYEDAAW